jgi:hypothetical protein
MPEYLWHVTLDTGQARRSPRAEVSEATLAIVGPHLRQAIQAGSAPLPMPGGWALKATASGKMLLATIVSPAGVPILTFGVAPRTRDAARLWTIVLGGRSYPAEIEPGQPPAAPWCAVRIETPELVPQIAGWAADYERCIARAWIERRALTKGHEHGRRS